MKKYPSKISYGLLIFVFVVPLVSTVLATSPPQWTVLMVNLLFLAFVLYLLFNTYYVIDGKVLIIRAGFVVNKKVDIDTISIIAETNSFVSSPAASLDRLNIIYNKHNSVLVSPKDKAGFIAHLTRLNPNITVFYKASNG